MFKERIERLFPFIGGKKKKEFEEPEEWLVTGEVPGHGLVTASPQTPGVQAQLKNGELEKVGEVSVYIDSPQLYLVVKRTAVTAGVVAASAVAGFGIYKTIEYFLKRRRKSHSK